MMAVIASYRVLCMYIYVYIYIIHINSDIFNIILGIISIKGLHIMNTTPTSLFEHADFLGLLLCFICVLYA